MRRVVHLSDLHFGRDRPALLTPLLHAVNSLAPDLVVISGDFTQRARPEQFKTAAAFIAALQPPTLSIPGNHDVPLDNLLLRIFLPWRGYRKWIDRDLYVVVYGLDGMSLAHGANPKQAGVMLIDRKDIDGKEFIKERVEMAKAKASFWQDYKFQNPASKKVEPKTMYCERLNETAVCAGVYK